MTTSSPRLFGIVGENIGYSLSPHIFNTLFRSHGISAVYAPFDITHDDLPKFLAFTRTRAVAGFNVTIPFKEAISRHLAQSDPIAETTGSTNLVIVKSGLLHGFNTDVAGIAATIEQRLQINVAGKSVLVLGAGGAARAVAYYLARRKCAAITILNRSRGRLSSWRRYLRALSIEARSTLTTPGKPLQGGIQAFDLCVNCTPRPIAELLNPDLLDNCQSIFELRYSPSFRDRKRHVDGKLMLAVQAAENWRRFTGFEIDPREVMKIIVGAGKS